MTNCIEIKGLTKAYADFALSDIALTLPGGAIMGLIGEMVPARLPPSSVF